MDGLADISTTQSIKDEAAVGLFSPAAASVRAGYALKGGIAMQNTLRRRLKLDRTWQLHLLILLPLAFLAVFNYWPMVGFSIAFQRFMPTMGFFGSPWIGLDNFRQVLRLPNLGQVLVNTLVISAGKIVVRITLSTIIALMLHEIRGRLFKRAYQSIALFPYFLSWVILGGIFIDVFSTRGAFGAIAQLFGREPIFFLGDPKWFRTTLIVTSSWKGYGYDMVILIAALSSIDPTYYEAADIDGANNWQKLKSLTFPAIVPTIILLVVMAMGTVLSDGFDQVFVLYNALVYETGDILATLSYRMGFEQAQYSLSTAISLFQSAVGLVLVLVGNWIAGRAANYRVL